MDDNNIEEKTIEEQTDMIVDSKEINKVEEEPLSEKKEASKKIKFEKDDSEVSFDITKAKGFLLKYGWVLLLLIPIIFSIGFRIQPAYLPITDDWAENTVYSNIENQIKGEINSQYPNLPEANRNALIESKLREEIVNNQDAINSQIKSLSNQFKQNFQDDTGQTYLLAIDPYYYYRHSQHYLENNQAGTEYLGGEYTDYEDAELFYSNRGLDIDFSKENDWDEQRMAPVGSPSKMSFHVYVIIVLFSILGLFGASLLTTAFFVPLIIATLAVIPAYFLGKRISGTSVGGVFAGMIVALNPLVLSRTVAGFSDTDAYNIFFPLLILWLFYEAFITKDKKWKYIFTILAGFFTGLFAYAWAGWFFTFDLIIGATIIYLLYLLFISKGKFIERFKSDRFKYALKIFIIFLIISSIFVIVFSGFGSLASATTEPFGKAEIKSVAVSTVWPNVKTTVAELNPASFKDILNKVGGKLLFFLGIVGIGLTLLYKDKYGKIDTKFAILLILWFIGSIFASFRGTRFIILLVPGFALAFGAFAGIIYDKLGNWFSKGLHINKIIVSIIVIVLLCLLLIGPLKTASATVKNEVPSMNDAWWNTLTYIKTNTSEDSIVNSWWDFGHWFITVADRRVTFDGAGNDNYMAYWIGRSLYTDNEDLSVGILRMVDCGNNNAFWQLNKEIEKEYVAIDILNEIVQLDKDGARKKLEEYNVKDIDSVLQYTHCDAPDNYYITSEDMVGKAGVWAHFGSWDFHRATMYNKVHQMIYDEGIDYLMKEFNLDEDEADKIYYEIQSEEPNKWISGWPGYMSGLAGCSEDGDILICDRAGLLINLTDYSALIATQDGKIKPEKLGYIDENNEFAIKEFDSKANIGALLTKSDGSYKAILMDPDLVGSMFTRLFYLEGLGLEHFDLFYDDKQVTGGEIFVWKVDWQGEGANVYDEVKEVVDEVQEDLEEVEENIELIDTDDTEINESEAPNNETEE